jgi:carboxymethylenebutenolidase
VQQLTSGWIDVPDGRSSLRAYVARPSSGDSPVVLVGFEMFGVTGYVRKVADRLAAAGYTAVVPDFYHRLGDHLDLPVTAEGRAAGLDLLQRMDRDGVVRDVRAVLDHLGNPSRRAMLGLSVGGHLAYYVATQVPLAAAAVFYPGWLTDTGIALSRPEPTLDLTAGLAALGTPLLMLIGADDHLFTDAQRKQIAARLRSDGVRHELVVYPDTPHGFFCDERDTYRPDAARDAWNRVRAFLDAAFTDPPA